MDHLFIARHGSYFSNTEELTSEGLKQMESLASKVSNVSDIVRIVSSTAKWAEESANKLVEILGLNPEVLTLSSYIYQGPGITRDSWFIERERDGNDKIITLANDNGRITEGGVIVLSHHTVVRDFPVSFVYKAFGERTYIMGNEVKTGSVVHIDMKNTPHYRGLL